MVQYSELITERREAAEALRQSRAQYETFVNATDDMAFLKDHESRYIMVNAANARFFGRQPDDIIGLTDTDLMPPDAAAERASPVTSAPWRWAASSSPPSGSATASTNHASSRWSSAMAASASAATCAT